MKAKYYIGILSVLLLTGSTVKAQIADIRDYRNNDFYFSSRINRFHRSYAAFNYYAPVFTDTYWYNYQPYSWGVSIYGGGGFGIGYSFNSPAYRYDYGFNNGGYNPYFGNSYYMGYDPFYYNNWYTPVLFNVRIRSRWHNDYYDWGRHNQGYNDYRPVYNTDINNYKNPSTKYSSSGNSSGRRSDYGSESSSGNVSRREVSTVNSSTTDVNRVPVNDNTGNITKSTNPSNVQVNRRVEQQVSPVVRRTSVSLVSDSSPSRTVSTPARTSSSSKSGTSAAQRISTSAKAESKSAKSSSSSTEIKSTRRR
ncbi:MAG: hypothetical protein NT144_00995 [Bacteroidia bacterium]|nr:hypothetical protein [Bacteroidia bacterium]